LTASQKDGVVRVWSWGSETTRTVGGSIKIEHVRQIFLRMVPPPQCSQGSTTSTSTARTPSRRRSESSSKPTLQVHCDMATWTSDDAKIITSQCCVLKANGLDIVPGSHIIHVWDSKTGQCIIGLPSVHDKPCPVLISHPTDPSIMASAGADGCVRIWNLTSGECLFSHRNIHKYGSMEDVADRGKKCGYLDGSFSTDGLNLVLTDDTGRITIIDTLQCEEEMSTDICNDTIDNTNGAPFWMKEQYFANDYYELFYDLNGYCIERGSRQPPHLAPEAARCNHTGSAFDAKHQEALSMLNGPRSICENEVRIHRDEMRLKSFEIRKPGGILAQNVLGTRTLIEAYPCVSSHIIDNNSDTTIMTEQATHPSLPRAQVERQRPESQGLSSRYRWIDYDDVPREDDDIDEVESDYEENHNDEPGRSPRRRRGNSRNAARSRRRNNRNSVQSAIERFEEVINNEPSRTSVRQSTRRSNTQQYNDEDSDGSVIEEMLSANTTPGGEYIKDYIDLGHLFKIPFGGELKRKWVSRNDCIEGYTGYKTYSPQVGDSVVYIPKAHSDTLKEFPICNNSSTGAPWKSWQKNSHWPVVQCKIKNIRYRFPYNG
jgi:hypothetical protein